MRLDFVLFAMVLGMCAVLAATYVVQEQPVADITQADGTVAQAALGHGVANPAHETMRSGGDGAARYENTWWLGLVFGLFQIAFFLVSLAFGARKQGGLGPLKTPLIVGGILYTIAFAGMILSHRTYVHTADPALFLGFPIPTAWMMYGVWLVPIVFMFLYLFTFDSWTFTKEDAERFERIVAERAKGAPET